MAKGVAHKGNSEIAHAEAALGAGRAYEKINEGHNQMFNDIKDLNQHHNKDFARNTKQSRGDRIDHELEEQDRKTIEKMNELRQKKEEAKHTTKKEE